MAFDKYCIVWQIKWLMPIQNLYCGRHAENFKMPSFQNSLTEIDSYRYFDQWSEISLVGQYSSSSGNYSGIIQARLCTSVQYLKGTDIRLTRVPILPSQNLLSNYQTHSLIATSPPSARVAAMKSMREENCKTKLHCHI